MTDDELKKYLTAEQLSRRYGLSTSTIHRLKKAGKIPFLQPAGKGGRLLFPADAIEQSVQSIPQPAENQTGIADSSKRLSGRLPKWMQPPPPNNHE
jgi:excisionase family DNA binding protein